MGRFIMYTTIGVLAVFVLSSYFVLEHGGGSIAKVSTVTVQDLSERAPLYEGTPVTTEGTLEYNDAQGRYQVVDDGRSVILREHPREPDLQALLGERVRVSGTFGYDNHLDIFIDASAVSPAPTP